MICFYWIKIKEKKNKTIKYFNNKTAINKLVFNLFFLPVEIYSIGIKDRVLSLFQAILMVWKLENTQINHTTIMHKCYSRFV
jgi:hypothetical protein